MIEGSSTACTINVSTTTPDVMRMISSRNGKGPPPTTVSGTASAAASDTAPRNPAADDTSRWRAPTRRSRC
jgi:hypothetical protein